MAVTETRTRTKTIEEIKAALQAAHSALHTNSGKEVERQEAITKLLELTKQKYQEMEIERQTRFHNRPPGEPEPTEDKLYCGFVSLAYSEAKRLSSDAADSKTQGAAALYFLEESAESVLQRVKE